MKSGIVLVLSIIMLSPLVRAGDTNWSWQAETRIRNEIHDNPAGGAGGSLSTFDHEYTEQRTMLALEFNQGEAFKGKIGLIHAFNWGDDGPANGNKEFNGAAGATETADAGNATPRGISDQQNLLLVNEAWLWWAFGDSLAVEGGRSPIEIGDNKVLSRNSDAITPFSFDGVKVHYDADILLYKAYAVKLFDGFNPNSVSTQGTSANDPETNLFGSSLRFKGLPDWFRHLTLHYFKVYSDGSSITPDGQSESDRFGLFFGGRARFFSYKATVAHHSGESTVSGATVTNSGLMADGEIKFSFPEFWNFFLSVGYHYDSGDSSGDSADGKNENYDSFFYDRHVNAGLMDIIEWGNLTYIYGAIGFTKFDIETVIQLHIFTQTEKTSPTNLGTHGTFLGAGAGTATTVDNDASNELGSELDVKMSYQFENGLKSGLRLGIFKPGEEFGTGNDKTYAQIVLEGTMKF